MKLTLAWCSALLALAPCVAIAQDDSAAAQRPDVQRAAPSTGSAYDLGVVVARREGTGLTIMAVTPGGGAERMKLRAGDRLLSINGLPLDSANPAATLQQALALGGRTVRLEVGRGGLTFVADDTMPALRPAVAPVQGCGHVTERGPTPTLSENIFPARITRIAGASTPLYSPDRHRLAAGRQVLVVAERIPASRFSSIQLAQRQRMLRQRDARAYKVLIVDVEPGTKYHVGAQLLPDNTDRTGMLANEYWRPVVWKQVPDRCP